MGETHVLVAQLLKQGAVGSLPTAALAYGAQRLLSYLLRLRLGAASADSISVGALSALLVYVVGTRAKNTWHTVQLAIELIYLHRRKTWYLSSHAIAFEERCHVAHVARTPSSVHVLAALSEDGEAGERPQ